MTRGSRDTSILDRSVDPVVRTLTPEVMRALIRVRAGPKAQARMEVLVRRCNRGSLSPKEREEYETSIRFASYLAVIQAKARGLLRGHDSHRWAALMPPQMGSEFALSS